jgi:mannose-6-phosphate isomerase
MMPIVLGPNQPQRFYRGGAAIAAFRDMPVAGDHLPEDWVGSTTCLFGRAEVGLTRLPTGERLVDAIAGDPEAWLGPEHVRVHGSQPALLVKLLDAGERLPVHAHPDRDFAARALGSGFGKTEAWIVLEAPADACVFVGFQHDVDRDVLSRWVVEQDRQAMLSALNQVRVRPGDAVLVPAGLPHAISEGLFLVELQEPTDFSVLLEWRGFDIDGMRDGHLGLGFETALDCVHRSGLQPGDLRRLLGPAPAGAETTSVLPTDADPFFRADRHGPRAARLERGYSILVVTAGAGQLVSADAALDIYRGMTLLVPFAAGDLELRGSAELIRCRPPDQRTP